jgi:hypothetical protein
MNLCQKVLAAVLFVGVLGWAPSVTASPIPYSFTEYHAYALADSALFHFGSPIIDEDIKPSPPVSTSAFVAIGYAKASALSNSTFSAESFGKDFVDCSAFLEATYKFTSTFPGIRIQYSYIFNAHTGLEFSQATGNVNSHLKDLTSGLTIWSDNPMVEVNTGEGVTQSNSIDKVLSLVLGHDYELFLSCGTSGSAVFFSHGYAKAVIENISVTVVPIPSGFILLSSGLVGLLGFRKRFKR